MQKISSNANQRNLSYFVHLHITPGDIDDYKKMKHKIEKIADNPVSIFIIKLLKPKQLLSKMQGKLYYFKIKLTLFENRKPKEKENR